MNLKRKNKINKSIQILSYQEIKKRRVFDMRQVPQPVTQNPKPSFLELGSRKLSEWKLKRIRKKALQAENTENGSLYESLIQKLSFEKIRNLASMRRKKLAVGIITAIVAVGGVFVYFQTRVGATTYQWLQATWSGGADTVNFPNHTNNQNGWLKYYSKDSQIDTSNDELKITSTSGNYQETSDTDFNAGNKTDYIYVGSNNVTPQKPNTYACESNNDTLCQSGRCDATCQAKLANGSGSCDEDSDCTAGNCDADLTSGNYCHATASSCVDFASGTPWEIATGYLKRCSGNNYYKDCSNSAWVNQVNNPNSSNSYCDAGGGTNSGYWLANTCTNGVGFGPACTSACSPYKANSTSSCYPSCATDDNAKCWSGYHCYSANNSCQTNANGGSCDLDAECTSGYCNLSNVCAVNPWISGYCGVQVYNVNSGTPQWKTAGTDCRGPECALGLDQNFSSNYALIASNSVNYFAAYPARLACYNLGGRLPTVTELGCLFTNRVALGMGNGGTSTYWSNVEYDTANAYVRRWDNGGFTYFSKTSGREVRCVR